MNKKIFLSFLFSFIISVFFLWADVLLTNHLSFQKTVSLDQMQNFSKEEISKNPISLNQSVVGIFPSSSVFEKPSTNLLFEKFSLVLEKNSLSFYQKEYKEGENILLTAFSVTLPIQVPKEVVYSSIKNQIEMFLQGQKGSITEIQKYGEKSFVIRLESEPQMMYIVIVFENRLLGISFVVNDVSRVKSVDALLIRAFPHIL